MSEQRKDFFISYRTLDKSWAEWIAWQLEAAGYSVHVQAWDFRPGGNFVSEMHAGSAQCERTIAVLSRAYTQSEYTEAEWCAAFAKDPRGERGLLLPVRVDDCEVEGLLRPIIHIDLFGVEESAARERLLAGVKPGRGKPQRSPQYPGAVKPTFPPLDRSNPYRGLAHFQKEHRSDFHGRARYIADVSSALNDKRLVCIIGASGSGKSSLAQAGVLPAEGDRGWLTAVCRPHKDPFRELARGLMPLLRPGLRESGQIWLEAKPYAKQFRDSPGDLEDLLNFLINKNQAPGLIILVDQLEELFSQVSEPDRTLFVKLLDGIWEARQSPVKWLLTLRADFTEQALQFDRLRAMLQDATVLLGSMDEQELYAAIVEPAQMRDVRFEPGLPDRLVQETITNGPNTKVDAGGTLAGRLPLLEFTLTALWMRQKNGVITHADYDDPGTGVGGIGSALRQHAESIYADYDDDRKARTRRLFRRLVERGPGLTDVRRLVLRDEVAADWNGLVVDLAKQRLVTTGELADGEATVEIIHEVLLRSWPALRGWIIENREFDRWRQDLTEQCTKWEQASTAAKPDLLLRGTLLDKALVNQREHASELNAREMAFIHAGSAARERASRGRKALFAAAFAVIASIAGLAGWQWWGSEQQRQRALARALAAEATQLVERGQGTDAEFRAAALAVESWNRMPNADAQAVAIKLMKRMPVTRYADPPMSGIMPTPIRLVTFSTDGRYLAVGRQHDGIRLIDLVTGEERVHLGSDEPAEAFSVIPLNLGFSPDSSVLLSLISAGEQQRLDLIRTATGEVLFSASGKRLSYSAYSKDSRYFAFASGDGVQMIDLDTGRQVLQVEQAGADQPLFSPDGTLVATPGYRGASLVEVPTGNKRASIESKEYAIRWYFSADGKFLLMEPFDEKSGLQIVDTETGSATATIKLSTSGPRMRGYRTSEDAGMVAVEEMTNNRIRFIALSNAEEKRRFEDSAEVRWFDLYDDAQKLLVWRWPDIIQLIDTGSGEVLRRIDFGEEIESVDSEPGHGFFVVAGKEGATATYTSDAGLLLARFEQVGSLVGWSPNAEHLVTSEPVEGAEEKRFRFYDTRDGHELADVELDAHSGGMGSLFSVDGRFLALRGGFGVGEDLLVVDTLGLDEPLWMEQADASPLRLSPDGRNVAIVKYDNRIWVASADTQKPQLFIAPTHDVSGTKFSADGQFLAVWGKDNARLFEVATGIQRAEIPATGQVSQVRFSSDGRVLALAGQDGWARIIDTASGSVVFELDQVHTPNRHQILARGGGMVSTLVGEKLNIEFHPNGELVAVIAEESRQCRVVDALTGAEHFNIQLDAVPGSVTFSPDGSTLAIGTYEDNTTRLIDMDTGTERTRLEHQIAPGWRTTALPMFAPDSQTIAVVVQFNETLNAWLFDPETAKERARVDAGKSSWRIPGDVSNYPLMVHHAVSFSPDGHYFAIGSMGGGFARLLDASSGHEVLRMKLGEGYVGVAFSPDGHYLAAASRNGAVRLVKIEEKPEIMSFLHGSGVQRLEFSPDSRTLATASEDGTVRFTQTSDGRAIARFEHGTPVRHIAFSSDGKWLATHSEGGVARLFLADPKWPIQQLCRRIGVNLTSSEWKSLIGPDESWKATCPKWRNREPN